mgnify:FL=1
MKRIKPLSVIMLGLFTVLLWQSRAWASVGIMPDYAGNLSEVNRMKTVYRISGEYYGEITFLSPENLQLMVDGEPLLWKISRDARFFCNGYEASWKALLPVTDTAYFEATVYINTEGEVCLVNGFYYGFEAIIRDYQYIQGRLRLTLLRPESGEIGVYWVDSRARLPKGSDWLQRENGLYFLYNSNGEIRGIFSE